MLVLLGMRGVYKNVVSNVICVAYTPEPKDLAVPNPVHQRLVGGHYIQGHSTPIHTPADIFFLIRLAVHQLVR
jgi:hypothetical protein